MQDDQVYTLTAAERCVSSANSRPGLRLTWLGFIHRPVKVAAAAAAAAAAGPTVSEAVTPALCSEALVLRPAQGGSVDWTAQLV